MSALPMILESETTYDTMLPIVHGGIQITLISRVTGSNAKEIDMIFPIKLANFLAGMSYSPKASCNCYLSLTSL